MQHLVPWLGYVAAYAIGGIVGFMGAALFCGSARVRLEAENDLLRQRIAEFEEPGTTQAALENGLAA